MDSKELELAKVEKLIQSQLTTLTAYRKSLIHECVTGKRRISDADVARAGSAQTGRVARKPSVDIKLMEA